MESPTATATATPPNFTVLLSDNFDSGYPTQWNVGTGSWVVPGDNGGYVLVSYNDDRLSPLVEGDFYNVVAEARFLVEYGSAMIEVRRSETGNYVARLYASGTVELFRSGVLIAAGTVATPGMWHTLRLSAVAGDVRVSLDGVEVITWVDSAPVAAGIIRLAGGHPGQSGFSMDDVTIWVPPDEVPLPTETALGKVAAREMALQSAGDQIVFVQVVNGHNVIYAMNSDGSNIHPLTADTYNSIDPEVSPDGTQIVFASDRDTPSSYDIYKMDSDGSDIQRITTLGNSMGPSWAPDASEIVFVSYDGDSEIFVVNAEGTTVEQLTNNTTEDRTPEWSPGETQIAYSSIYLPNQFSAFWRVMVMNVDGSGQTYLTADNINAHTPDWSHDGAYIGYTQQAGMLTIGFSSYPYYDIYKMAANGGNKTNLTQTVSVFINGGQQLVNEYEAIWSSSDSQIAYLREVTTVSNEAWAMNNDGSGQSPLSVMPSNATVKDWEVLQAPPADNSCISRPIDEERGLNIRSAPQWGNNYTNRQGGRLRITGYYRDSEGRWLRVDPYIDPQGLYTQLTGWVWEDVFQNPCEDGRTVDSLPIMDINGNIVAIPTPIPSPTPIPPPPTPDYPTPSCQGIHTNNPTQLHYAWYESSPILKQLEQYATVDIYARTEGGSLVYGSTVWYHVIFTSVTEGQFIGWIPQAFLDANELTQLCQSVPTVIRTLPPTNTPLPPTYTPTPPPNLDESFPLPMIGPGEANPPRLTPYGCSFGGILVPSRDINPRDLNGNFPVIVPTQATVIVVDENLEEDTNQNGQLGVFIAIRIQMQDIPAVIQERLEMNNNPFGPIDTSQGAIYIGYAHLLPESVPSYVVPGAILDAETPIAQSGASGGEYIPHLDISVFYVPNAPHMLRTDFLPYPEYSAPNPDNPANPLPFAYNYQAYFTMYDLTQHRPLASFGEPIIVNPLALWPSLQEGTGCSYEG